ncbi:MAG: LecA/PA-IL family lectin [Acidobacteriota bacterium]
MQPRGLITRVIASAAILSIVSLSIFADTIRLKDGSIIKGKIMRFTGGVFSVQIGDGSRKREMTFSADEIESIQFDAPDLRPTAEARDKPSNIINVSTAPSNPPKVITTDSTKSAIKNSTASEDPPVGKKPVGTPKTPIQTPASKSQPIELNLKVLADNTSNGWTNSGWVVRKGQRIRISGDGSVSLGKGQKSSPSGLPDLADEQKLLKSVATGALIAVIGDDNNDFIYVGAQREFTASRDGTLFLGVNEGNLDDNSGSYNVKIEIIPENGN